MTSRFPKVMLSTGPAGDGGSQGATWLMGKRAGADQRSNMQAPALLVSYVYLQGFEANRQKYFYRDWALDSGAFSAHNSGEKISLQRYIDTCKRLRDSDPTLTEVFALDVIGNEKASLKNTEEMWRQGVEAVPCYHRGEPEALLKHIAASYPKIALGGVAMLRGSAKIKWASACFDRVWPKKVHGFGFGTAAHVLALPWHSVDATNWETGPCSFGQWKKFGRMSVRGSSQNLRSQVDYYLELESKARIRWAAEMAQLDVRLAYHPEGGRTSEGPVVRLAEAGSRGSKVFK